MVRVGFIGLGHMGGPMAHKLVEAEYDLVVFDLVPDRVESLVRAGADSAETAREVARRSDVVFLCLPSHEEVEAVVLGDEGIGTVLDPGDILVDTTTSSPEVSAKVAAALSDRNVTFLGAPVSGGPTGARDGTLTVMVGGEADAVETCTPLFESFASDVFHVGDQPGHGHAMKLLNNYLSYVNFVATTEVTLAGNAIGLDEATMIDVINRSSGHNSWTEDKFPDEILTGDYDLGASLAIGEKDVALGWKVISTNGPDIGLGDVILEAIREAAEAEGYETDLTRLFAYYERQSE